MAKSFTTVRESTTNPLATDATDATEKVEEHHLTIPTEKQKNRGKREALKS